jgi:hypothetical protein
MQKVLFKPILLLFIFLPVFTSSLLSQDKSSDEEAQKQRGEIATIMAPIIGFLLSDETIAVPSVDIAYKYAKATQGTDESYHYYKPALNTIDHNDSSYNYTKGDSSENWLQLELPLHTKITKIVIQGRPTKVSRLQDAKVYITDTAYNGMPDKGSIVATLEGSAARQVFDFSPSKSGSYLVVKAAEDNKLHLVSVEIYGHVRSAPVFINSESEYLISGATTIGTKVALQEAVDYQDDVLTYSLSGSVPFAIDSLGRITLDGALSVPGSYTFDVRVSDGSNVTTKNITIDVTANNAVDAVLESADVISTPVTEGELIQALLDELNSSTLSDDFKDIETLLRHFQNEDFNLDFKQCGSKDCNKVDSLTGDIANLITAAKTVKSILNDLDRQKVDIFAGNGYRLEKLLALTGDKIRQKITYPASKNRVDATVFAKTVFADASVYNYRKINPLQPDMGNFSRSDFSTVTPVTRTVDMQSKRSFRSTGAYALPGQTLKVTRIDTNSDLKVKVFVNSVRSGATHQYVDGGYNRPKYLQTPHMQVDPGETIEFTSCYGGPLELEFSKSDINVSVKFENVGEHPYWAFWDSEAHRNSFADKLDAGNYDWAEMATGSFEVHSKLDKMKESIKNWADLNSIVESAENLIAGINGYTAKYPYALAGYRGNGLEIIREVVDFANDNSLVIEDFLKVKHMNADQASCGTGCSGNPYDAYWAFNPVGHGDIHEIGHGLEMGDLRFEGWEGHSTTNPYSYYTKSRYYRSTQIDSGCQKLPFEKMYTELNASVSEDDPKGYLKTHLWDESGWSEQMLMTLQAMMYAQKYGELTDGWHLLSRLQVMQRGLKKIKTESEWNDSVFGTKIFSDYTFTDFNNMRDNDRIVILYSYAAQLDLNNFFEMMGVEYSQKAYDQIENSGYAYKPGKVFFVSTPDGYCKKDTYGDFLDKQTIDVDGETAYPDK